MSTRNSERASVAIVLSEEDARHLSSALVDLLDTGTGTLPERCAVLATACQLAHVGARS